MDIEKKNGLSKKPKIIILIISVVILMSAPLTAYGAVGSDYNKSRNITINLNGGTLANSNMVWMFSYDSVTPGGHAAGTMRNGVATGLVHDRHGNVHRLGRKRDETSRNESYPFTDNQSPQAGTFTQRKDFVGQTPYIWLRNPTRSGYRFDGWSTTRTTRSHTRGGISGTLVHAGLSGGNFSITANWSDVTAPTLTITGNPTSWTNQNVSLSVTGSDTGSGVRRIQLPNGSWVNSASTTFTVTTNRTYTFIVEDNAGNTRSQSVVVNRIDKSNPNGTVTQNITGWTNQNVVLTFNATDTGGSGVRRVRQSGGTWVNGSSTTRTVTANGTYYFEVEDRAGNTQTIIHEVTNIDKEPPSETILEISTVE